MSTIELNHEDQVTVLALHRVSEGYNRLPWQLFNSLWDHFRTEAKIPLGLDEIGFELERQPITDDLSYSMTIQKDDWNELLQMSSDDSTEETLSMALVSHFESLEDEVILMKNQIVGKIRDIRRHTLLSPQEFATGYEFQGKYLSDYPECVADAFIHGEFETNDEDIQTVGEILNRITPTLGSAHKFCRILDKMLVPVARRSWTEVTSKPPEPRMLDSTGYLPSLAVYRCIKLVDRGLSAFDAEDYRHEEGDPSDELFRLLLSRLLHIKGRLAQVTRGADFFKEGDKSNHQIAIESYETALNQLGDRTPENVELRDRIKTDMLISQESQLGIEMSSYPDDPDEIKEIIFGRFLGENLGEWGLELPLDRPVEKPTIIEALDKLPNPDIDNMRDFEEAVENSNSIGDEDKIRLLETARAFFEEVNEIHSQNAMFNKEWERMISEAAGDSKLRTQLQMNKFLFHHGPQERIEFLSYKLKPESNEPYSKALIHLLRGMAYTEIGETEDEHRVALENAVEDLYLAAELMQGYLPVRRLTAMNYLGSATQRLLGFYPSLDSSYGGMDPTRFLTDSPVTIQCKAFLLSEIMVPSAIGTLLGLQQRCGSCSRIHVSFPERKAPVLLPAFELNFLQKLMQVRLPALESELEGLMETLRISLIATPGFNRSLIPPIPDKRLSSEGTYERFLQDGINSTITGGIVSFKEKYPSLTKTHEENSRPVDSIIWEIVYPETIIPHYEEMRGDTHKELERAQALERHLSAISAEEEQYSRIASEIENSYLAIMKSEREGSDFDDAQIRLGKHLWEQTLRSDAGGMSEEEIEAQRERGMAYFDEVPETSEMYPWARNNMGNFKFAVAKDQTTGGTYGFDETPDDDLEGLDAALQIFSSFTPEMEQHIHAAYANEEQDEIVKQFSALIGADDEGKLPPKLPFYYAQALCNKMIVASRISLHVDEVKYNEIMSDVLELMMKFSPLDKYWPSVQSIYSKHQWARARVEKSAEEREKLVNMAYENMLLAENHFIRFSEFSDHFPTPGISFDEEEYIDVSHLISSIRHYNNERDIIQGAGLSNENLSQILAGFDFSIKNQKALGPGMLSPIVDALFAIERFTEFIEGELEEGASELSNHEIIAYGELRDKLGEDREIYEALIRISDWSDEYLEELQDCHKIEKIRCENFGLEHLIPILDQLHERVLGLAGKGLVRN